jgi:hypothetical protein
MADAILDRLVNHTHKIALCGESMRRIKTNETADETSPAPDGTAPRKQRPTGAARATADEDKEHH